MVSTWTLIYATDSSGNEIAGSLDDFKDAVLVGADVKILYSPVSNAWWSRNCSSINVTRPNSTILIAATFMEAADTYNFGRGIAFTQDPFALEYHIYNTTGVRVQAKFNYQDQTLISEKNDIVPMKWYVKDYEIIPKWWQIVDDALPKFSENDDG